MNALWFSRHQPTPEQKLDALKMGYELVAVEQGMELGKVSLDTGEQLVTLAQELWALALKNECEVILGVWATPLLGLIGQTAVEAVVRGDWSPKHIACYGSWNVARAKEGEKPTFQHRAFIWLGCLDVRVAHVAENW
jgi:hypothetical protein